MALEFSANNMIGFCLPALRRGLEVDPVTPCLHCLLTAAACPASAPAGSGS